MHIGQCALCGQESSSHSPFVLSALSTVPAAWACADDPGQLNGTFVSFVFCNSVFCIFVLTITLQPIPAPGPADADAGHFTLFWTFDICTNIFDYLQLKITTKKKLLDLSCNYMKAAMQGVHRLLLRLIPRQPMIL